MSDRTVGGRRIVGHNGDTPEFEGNLDCDLADGWTVIILTNQVATLVPSHRRSEGDPHPPIRVADYPCGGGAAAAR